MNTRDLELVDNLTQDIKYKCGDTLLQYIDFYTYILYIQRIVIFVFLKVQTLFLEKCNKNGHL